MGAVYQYFTQGILRRIMSTSSFPNGISVSPNDSTLAVGDYAANRILYYSFLNRPNGACIQCAKDPAHTTFFFATARSYNPGSGGPDGADYDMHGNLWALCGIGGIIEYNQRGIIFGYVPLPNGETVSTNFAFGGRVIPSAQLGARPPKKYAGVRGHDIGLDPPCPQECHRCPFPAA